MKLIIPSVFISLFLLFSGCAEKKKVIYIENRGLCQSPATTLYIHDVTIENNSKTFNISANEIKLSLADSLSETNCYKVQLADKDASSLENENEYVLNSKVSIFQDKEVVEENIFKKEEKERITLFIALTANNNGKKVYANAKSELLTDKSKILGVEKGVDAQGDKEMILKSATKKVSIALTDGFSKLK
ncbi:MAG: hypothetical protein QG559_865 [Campylobacterota bacterium]|nr:hypothetical protein [Campylobacterota bacterium]